MHRPIPLMVAMLAAASLGASANADEVPRASGYSSTGYSSAGDHIPRRRGRVASHRVGPTWGGKARRAKAGKLKRLRPYASTT